MGLATVIGKDNKDASGRKIDAAMHTTMQTQAHTPSDRSLRRAFLELDMIKDKLGYH